MANKLFYIDYLEILFSVNILNVIKFFSSCEIVQLKKMKLRKSNLLDHDHKCFISSRFTTHSCQSTTPPAPPCNSAGSHGGRSWAAFIARFASKLAGPGVVLQPQPGAVQTNKSRSAFLLAAEPWLLELRELLGLSMLLGRHRKRKCVATEVVYS